MSRIAAFLTVATLALTAAAPLVTADPARAQTSGFSFADKGALTLDVGGVEIVTQYQPPLKEPNVDHLIAVTPTDAVKLWAQDRLRASGGSGTAQIIIRDASVVEEALKKTEGVKGWFTKDQSERYIARLDVEVRVDKPNFQGSTVVNVTRSTSVREDVSLAEREKAMLDLVRDLAKDLDAKLDPAIRSNLFGVLIL